MYDCYDDDDDEKKEKKEEKEEKEEEIYLHRNPNKIKTLNIEQQI